MRTLTTILGAVLLFCCVSNHSVVPTPGAIGFDIDDTVIESSPAFAAAYARAEGTEFWAVVNTSTHLCPLRPHVARIIREQQARGGAVYLITARRDTEGQSLRNAMTEMLDIPASHVFFAKPKTALIRSLRLTVFYGDSDSDIADALEAGALPVRVRRPAASSYTTGNNPGMYGEPILG